MTVGRALTIVFALGGIYLLLLFALSFVEVKNERELDRDRTRGKW
jgi:hypothetical protein